MELNLRRNSLYAVGEVVVSGLSSTAGGIYMLGGIIGHFLGSLGVPLASSGMRAPGGALTIVMNCRELHIRALPHCSELRSAVGETYGLLVR
jgi:hypothetical protein